MILIRFKFPNYWGAWVKVYEKTLEEARDRWSDFFGRYPNFGKSTLYEFREVEDVPEGEERL